MIVLAEQKKASVRVVFIGKKEAENLTYVSADYQAVSRVGGLDENLTVYIGQGKEPHSGTVRRSSRRGERNGDQGV